MDDLVSLAADLWRATGAGRDMRLVGGMAVRLLALAGEDVRTTRDVDVVAMTPESDRAVLEYLRARGFEVGDAGGWRRAATAGVPRRIVDVSRHPLVDVRTFDPHALHEEPVAFPLAGTTVYAAGVNDLVRLKLAAARDQDLVDVMLLTRTGRASAQSIADAAEIDDTERRIADGAVHARFVLGSGGLEELSQDLLDRSPTEEELAAMRSLLDALEKEGL